MRWHVKYLRELDPKNISLLIIALGFFVGVLVTATSVGAGAIGVTVLVLRVLSVLTLLTRCR